MKEGKLTIENGNKREGNRGRNRIREDRKVVPCAPGEGKVKIASSHEITKNTEDDRYEISIGPTSV